MKRISFSSLATAAGCALVLAGVAACGDDGLPRRVPVSGKVTYKGQPLEKGTINFFPEDESGRPASGAIANGSYRMTTLTPDDGVIPGKYKVTISALDPGSSKELDAATSVNNMPDQVDVAKVMKKAKKIIPDRYGSIDGSGLSVVVPGGSYNFDLQD